MKRVLILLMLFAASARAQTIKVGPITKLNHCVGDTLIVPYTATGNFQSSNFFAVQLSDANGSFANFTNVGHSTALVGAILLPLESLGDHFRVRVISTSPYIVSDTNDVDIRVFAYPSPAVRSYGECSASGFVGASIPFGDQSQEPSGSTFQWSFNQDASVASSTAPSVNVVYASPGFKTGNLTVTNAAGCTKSTTFTIQVVSCHPAIPASVHVVTGTESGSQPVVWVRSGANYTVSNQFGSQTIFAEPGSSVVAAFRSKALYYLKPGVSFNSQDDQGCALVVAPPGDSIISNSWNPNEVLHCNVSFDYSHLPDSLQPPSVVTSTVPATRVLIRQLANAVYVEAVQEFDVRILNLLGARVLSRRGSGTLTLDLSSLPAGVYFALVRAGGEQVVKRIAVVK